MNLPHTTALRPSPVDGWLRLVGMLVGLSAREVAQMSLADVLYVTRYRLKDRGVRR